jgi:alpha-tubulin suppressor-like RCC1 family protein
MVTKLMNDHTPQATAAGDARPAGISRRSVITTAAWSVPAVALTASSPAFAASNSALLTLSAPSGRVPAKGATTVTATMTTTGGTPQTGTAVSFTGPTGSTFSPVSAVTNGSGVATTSFDLAKTWTMPGSSVLISAVAGSESKNHTVTVVGANLACAGQTLTSSFVQEALAFPSPVVQMASAAVPGTSTPALTHVALLQDGTVWTRGSNNWGQLGDGTRTRRDSWAQVSGLSGVTKIAVGNAVVWALLSSGSVYAWGWNVNGQLGDGTTTAHSRPALVTGLPRPARALAGGPRTGYAVLDDGSVWAWGSADSYRIINGAYTRSGIDLNAPDALSPVQMEAFSNVREVAVWSTGGMVVTTSGSLLAWGPNDSGQLGDGSSAGRASLGAVSGLPRPVVEARAAGGNRYALLDDGSVWSWGSGGDGLGDGSSADRSTPARVPGVTGTTMGTGTSSTLVVRAADGSVWGWGTNSTGALGTGSTTACPTPTSLPVPTGAPGVRAIGSGFSSSTSLVFGS